MINRKLYLRSNIIGIAVILVVLGVYFLYKTNVLSHDGIDFVSLRMNGIFSGSLWGGVLSSIITLITSHIVIGWLLWLSIFEGIFNLISRRDDIEAVKDSDKSIYRVIWVVLLVSHVLTFICDLVVKSMPWDNRPKFNFAYSSDQILVLVAMSILVLTVMLYRNSRKILLEKGQKKQEVETSSGESLNTTEVEGA